MRLTGQDGQPPDPAAAHGHFEAAAAQEFAPGMWFVVVDLLWLFVVVCGCLLWLLGLLGCVCVFCIVCPLSCLFFCSSPFNSLLFFCFPVSLVQPNTSVVFIVVVSVERVGDWPHGQRERHGHGTTARFHQSQRVLSPRGKTKLRRRPFQPGRTVQGRAGGGTGTWLYMVMHG